jgi:hypothetical protein
MSEPDKADRAKDVRRLVELGELTEDEGVQCLREIYGPDTKITELGYRSMLREVWEGPR